jgi:hypothetical protein
MKPVQTPAAAKVPHILHRIGWFRTLSANAGELLHGLHPLVTFSEITFADRFPDEFRHGGLLGVCASVKSDPEIFVEV